MNNNEQQVKGQGNAQIKSVIKALVKYGLIIILILIFIFEIPIITNPIKSVLEAPRFTLRLGQYSINIFSIIHNLIVILLLYFFGKRLQQQIEFRLRESKKLKFGARKLITKVSQIAIIVIAFSIMMDLFGVNWSALKVFAGTIGIGLGFGLQNIASNFISGIILTLEETVEEGDLIELSDGTTGVVEEAGARYTRISTYDGCDIMVPNEDFIKTPVKNWTFKNNRGRAKILIRVAYDTDIEVARDIIMRCAEANPDLSVAKSPICYFKGYSDYSADFLLYIWVDDVKDGHLKPSSDIQFAIWREFKNAGIKAPSPINPYGVAENHSNPTDVIPVARDKA